MSESESRSGIVLELAEEFLERYRRGERPPLTEYIDRHPHLEAEIRKIFPAMAMMENIAIADASIVADTTGAAPVTTTRPLSQLGDYRIIREAGRGGMGVVYEAEQISLGRHVALKVLPGHGLLNPTFLERFRREAKAAARLHHTNIVPVFGTGEENGTHFYAMQFIRGEGLDKVLNDLRQLRQPGKPRPAPGPAEAVTQSVAQSLVSGSLVAPVSATAATAEPSASSGLSSVNRTGSEYFRSVARIGVQVADALAYANKQGVLHRDIKPSNLLLDMQGTVWITDFGLAKADGDDLTHTGDIVGTIRYMAPERFDGKSLPQSDVYSLGLTLYEMATLQPAFDASNRGRLVEQVLREPPVPPRKIDAHIPRDLETIVLKCVAKDPQERYATAESLAEDLRRFLADRTIQARRATMWEQTRRWARRNPAIASLLGIVALLLLSISIASSIAAMRFREVAHDREVARDAADDERHKAVEAGDEARRRGAAERWERYRANITAGANALQLNNVGAAERSLNDAPVEHRGWEWRHFASLTDDARWVLRARQDRVEIVAFSPDGRYVASGGSNKTVAIWDTFTGREHWKFHNSRGVNALAFSSDGTRIGCGSHDGAVVWDVATGKETFVLDNKDNNVTVFPFSAAGIRLTSGRFLRNSIRFLDVVTGKEIARTAHTAQTNDVAVSRDGRWIAATGNDHFIQVCDAQSGTKVTSLDLRGLGFYVASIDLSPDGTHLVTGSGYPDNQVRLWSLARREPVVVMPGHGNSIGTVAFSPDGTRIASGSFDQTVRLWDGTTGKSIAVLRGHSGRVYLVAFSPDGKRLVSASQDRTVRLWDAATGDLLAVLRGHTDEVLSLAFSPDGEMLASASADGTVRIWEMELVTRRGVLRGHTSFVYDVAFSPDGSQVASAAWDGTVRFWDATTGRQTGELTHLQSMVISLSFSRDSSRLAVLARDDAVHLWDLTNKSARKLSVPTKQYGGRVAFSPNGNLVAACGDDGQARIWNAQTAELVALLLGHEGVLRDVAFDPSGRRIASVANDKSIRVWDVETKEVIRILHGHTQSVHAVAFSGDGKLIATGSWDGTARLWDAATFDELAILPHGGNVYKVAFSPDGTRLATGCADNAIHLWDLATHQEVAELRGHDTYVHSVAWSPDGTRLVSGSGDKTVRIWDSLSAPERAKRLAAAPRP